MKTKKTKMSKPRPFKTERRYQIQGDNDGHEYFVEVGMEGEFEKWIESEENGTDYEGYDYEKNRIDGHFTFTDLRCE